MKDAVEPIATERLAEIINTASRYAAGLMPGINAGSPVFTAATVLAMAERIRRAEARALPVARRYEAGPQAEGLYLRWSEGWLIGDLEAVLIYGDGRPGFIQQSAMTNCWIIGPIPADVLKDPRP